MKTKPALWAVAGLPLLFLLLLAGSVRGLSYLSNPSGDGPSVQNAPQEDAVPTPQMTPADPRTAMEIKKAAGGQIAALQKHNYKEALKFALPDFQKMMTPLTFGRMIESDFNELATAKTVTLDAPKVSPNGASAQIFFVTKDAQNKVTRFVYLLVRDTPPLTKDGKIPTATGVWRVSGCSRIPNAPLPPPVRSLHEA